MHSWKKLAQKTRVPVGTVLGILFLFLMHPSVRSLWIGGAIALAGGLLRLWAAGHIEKAKVLAQGGPYALQPQSPAISVPFSWRSESLLQARDTRLLLAFGAFFAIFYFPVMRAEEQELLQQHGDRFLEYSARVPLFFPAFSRTGQVSSVFLWSRVIRNREHQTMAGLILAVVLLILLKLIRAGA